MYVNELYHWLVMTATPISPQRLARVRQQLASGEAREIRRKARVSQAEVAAAVGVTVAAVSRWESGSRCPGTDLAARYARVLDALQRVAA